jgi:hypothetical protein
MLADDWYIDSVLFVTDNCEERPSGIIFFVMAKRAHEGANTTTRTFLWINHENFARGLIHGNTRSKNGTWKP